MKNPNLNFFSWINVSFIQKDGKSPYARDSAPYFHFFFRNLDEYLRKDH